MTKQAVFTMKLEPELREQFMAEAEASHRPASQIMREMMRQFVRTQQEAREYEIFYNAKSTLHENQCLPVTVCLTKKLKHNSPSGAGR